MSVTDYDRIDAVNISTLKELWSSSPLHYRHRLLTPREDKPAFAFGRLVHCAVLEPLECARRYVVAPRFDRRTKEGKAAAAEFEATIGYREMVSEDDWNKAQTMAEAVRANPIAAPYLALGSPEVTLQWTDEETGIACKGRVDWVAPMALVGLKTTREIQIRRFATSAARYGYHLQWAFYADGYEAIHGVALPTVEIVVESEPPHDVVVYEIPEDVIDVGREEYRTALEKLRWCRRGNEWVGVSGGAPVVFQLPRWARHDDEDDTLEGLEGL